MPSTIARFRALDPDADYLELVETLCSAAKKIGLERVATLVRKAVTKTDDEDERPKLADNTSVVTTPFPASEIGLDIAADVYLELIALPIYGENEQTDGQIQIQRVGRELIAALHPTDPTVDLSSVVLLTALAVALGTKTTQRGWSSTVRIPGTPWIGGICREPTVATGAAPALEAAPSDPEEAAAWRQRLADRARLVQAAAAAIHDQLHGGT
jgi:hypothetical protein